VTTGATEFHLFVSYTRTPDAALAREIERFLESFHQTKPPAGREPLAPLQICVDGSDFGAPPDALGVRRDRVPEVLDIVFEHLGRSNELLVLCSAAAAQSYWVEREVRWFLDKFGPGRVRIAFTEGETPWKDPARYYPQPILDHGLDKAIAYDLRGYDARRARSWKQVPEFTREMVKLAAHLHGLSIGKLYPTWLEAELERTRRQSATMATSARLETVAGDPSRAVLQAFAAHDLHPDQLTERALRDAYRVAVLHHYNRRETAQFSGSGPAYLAGRWKQGDVFTRTSPDGRFRLLVTERGTDGPQPPGEVYLVNNETLRAVKLGSPEQPARRVEEAAFDRSSTHVFVARHFDLSVYSVDGRFVGEYPFSTHTKSPIHLLDGFLAGRYVLGAASKGGAWLVVPGAGVRSTRTIHGEFHGDATVFSNISADGLRMALVYESGKARLLEVDEHDQPLLREVVTGGALYAGFPTGRSDLLVVAGSDGTLRIFDVDRQTIGEAMRTEPLGASVDGVSFDPDTDRLAIVGSDRKIRIVDGTSGMLLGTIDFSDEVDWRGALAVVVPPPITVKPGAPWDPGAGTPLADVGVAALESEAGDTWIVTEDGPNEYLPNCTVHRVVGGRAHRFAEGRLPVRSYGDVLVTGGGFLSFAGHAFWKQQQTYRPFPADGTTVSAVHEKDGVVWIGTASGAYRHKGETFERVTPPHVDISTIVEAGGRLWFGGKHGAYVLDGERLVRVTESFLDVSGVREAGGAVWILERSGMFQRGGGVYRIDDWFATPMPRRNAKDVVLLEDAGEVWLAEATELHRVRGGEVRTIAVEPSVTGIAQEGRTIWLTTAVRNILPLPGAVYRMDAETLEPVQLDARASYLARAGGRLYLVHPGDAGIGMSIDKSVSLVQEDDLIPLDLGDGWLQRIVEVNRQTWLLTSDAAFVLDGDRVVRTSAPPLLYDTAISVEGEAWLLAATGAVRMASDKPVFYDTAGHKAREILSIDGSRWILTGDTTRPGPAFRVRGSSATPESPDGAGVATIIPFDDAWWMLTRRDGRACPMSRVTSDG